MVESYSHTTYIIGPHKHTIGANEIREKKKKRTTHTNKKTHKNMQQFLKQIYNNKRLKIPKKSNVREGKVIRRNFYSLSSHNAPPKSPFKHPSLPTPSPEEEEDEDEEDVIVVDVVDVDDVIIEVFLLLHKSNFVPIPITVEDEEVVVVVVVFENGSSDDEDGKSWTLPTTTRAGNEDVEEEEEEEGRGAGAKNDADVGGC